MPRTSCLPPAPLSPEAGSKMPMVTTLSPEEGAPGTIEALAALETPKAKALFEKYKVVSPVELHARHEIQT
ncbi:hypothetical protein, partial [Intestinimonas sp.]|uniref:hypothetical protein n=1 Tax=Intestinimonas sp. TaxID=1965293 RepID=UPI003AB7DF0B